MKFSNGFKYHVIQIYIILSFLVCVLFSGLFIKLAVFTPAFIQGLIAIVFLIAYTMLIKDDFHGARVVSFLASYIAVFIQGFFFFDAAVGFHLQYLALLVVFFMTSELDQKADKILVWIALVAFTSTYVLIDNYSMNILGGVIPLSVQSRIEDLTVVVMFIAMFLILYSYSWAFNENIKELRYLATYDPLTKLINKKYFIESGEALLKKDLADNRICVAMIDIDNFKHINDTFGHLEGDVVLSDIGILLRNHFFNRGEVARYGGEEFAVILKDFSHDDCLTILEGFRQKVEENQFIVKTDHVIRMTVSIGVSFLNHENNSFDALLTRADYALYEAKGSGKNCMKICMKSIGNHDFKIKKSTLIGESV